MILQTSKITIIDEPQNISHAIILNLCGDNPTVDEMWTAIQNITNELLEMSDRTQLPDNGLSISKRLEWQDYRDNLRSIQNDFSNPMDIMFPEEPLEE